MGVNGPDNTHGEGNTFASAMGFYNKDKSLDDRLTPPGESTGEYERMIAENIVPDYKTKKFVRPSKDEYYLGIAEAVSARGTCIRRRFGAIIVKNDRIVSTGYVGAPRGRVNCCDRGKCFRMENNIPCGQRYELCRSVHAEMNAIINASKEELEGATLYLVGIEPDGTYTPDADCCSMCKRVIINSGVAKVIFKDNKGIRTTNVEEWIKNDDSLTIHEGY